MLRTAINKKSIDFAVGRDVSPLNRALWEKLSMDKRDLKGQFTLKLHSVIIYSPLCPSKPVFFL